MIWCWSNDAVSAELEDGTVVLNLHTKRYYSLNETATFVWARLAAGATVDALVDALLERYRVEPEHARDAASRVLRELEGHRLVVRSE